MTMNTHKIAIKLPLEGADQLHAETFVPLLHTWIQQQVLPEHLLIDVADYEHVVDGPGTVLIADEANIHIDRAEGETGLLYVRKRPVEGAGDLADRIRACLGWALQAAARLEQDVAARGVRIKTDHLVVRFNDRLAAPNTPEVFEQAKPQLKAVLSEVYGDGVELAHRADSSRLFEMRAKAPAAPAVSELLDRLGSTAPSR